jgi:hypothetical protein
MARLGFVLSRDELALPASVSGPVAAPEAEVGRQKSGDRMGDFTGFTKRTACGVFAAAGADSAVLQNELPPRFSVVAGKDLVVLQNELPVGFSGVVGAAGAAAMARPGFGALRKGSALPASARGPVAALEDGWGLASVGISGPPYRAQVTPI